jgi:predicted amidophosphoribosyltransferase
LSEIIAMAEEPIDDRELAAGRELAEGYCGQCGQPVVGQHRGCQARATLEPPRYCPRCGRRMVVQVKPVGWTANCSRHGELTG